MNLALILLSFAFLVALNAFFVFAEFAIVKVRSSQLEEYLEKRAAGAENARRVHEKLDEYLSTCQVGITFASVALGFVGEVVAADLLLPLFAGPGGGGSLATHAFATALAVVGVSFLHILLGEQVPKLAAIRDAGRAALRTARVLRFFHGLFIAPLWVLNGSAHAILRLFGIGAPSEREQLSEDELRILLERGQGSGLLSFRRLLFMENIFDLGEMRARDAMRSRNSTVCLSTAMAGSEIADLLGARRYSRFPLIRPGSDLPLGYIHVKDLGTLAGGLARDGAALEALARPALLVDESQGLEQVLASMQARRAQLALVTRDSQWTGLLTMEDILEEIVGTICDEYEEDPPLALAGVLSPGRVALGVEGPTIAAAVRQGLGRLTRADLPAPPEDIARAVAERERLASTYMGKGIAIPHAKLQSLAAPALLVMRSEGGIPVEGGAEQARLLFVLVTPAAEPRVHQKLLVRVAELLEASEYVVERLERASTAAEVCEIIVTGEQASID